MALILLLVVVVAFSAVRLFGFQVGDLWRDVAEAQGSAHTPASSDDGGTNPGNAGGGGSGLPGGGPEDTTTTTTTTTIP